MVTLGTNGVQECWPSANNIDDKLGKESLYKRINVLHTCLFSMTAGHETRAHHVPSNLDFSNIGRIGSSSSQIKIILWIIIYHSLYLI
jgi:hypothetical protein